MRKHPLAAAASSSSSVTVAMGGGRIRSLTADAGKVTSVATSTDTVIAGHGTGALSLWRSPDFRRVGFDGGHDAPVRALQPTNRTLGAAWCASGASDGVLALWDTAELPPRCTSRLQAHESDVRALALTDDGLLLASAGGDGSLCLWQMRGGQLANVARIDGAHSDAIEVMAPLAQSALLATGGRDHAVRVWESRDSSRPGDGSCCEPVVTLNGHTDWVTAVVSLSTQTGRRPQSLLLEVGETTPPLLASASLDRTVRLWAVRADADADDGSGKRWVCVALLRGHTHAVTALCLCRGGAASPTLASADAAGAVRLWSTAGDGACVRAVRLPLAWIASASARPTATFCWLIER